MYRWVACSRVLREPSPLLFPFLLPSLLSGSPFPLFFLSSPAHTASFFGVSSLPFLIGWVLSPHPPSLSPALYSEALKPPTHHKFKTPAPASPKVPEEKAHLPQLPALLDGGHPGRRHEAPQGEHGPLQQAWTPLPGRPSGTGARPSCWDLLAPTLPPVPCISWCLLRVQASPLHHPSSPLRDVLKTASHSRPRNLKVRQSGSSYSHDAY